MRDYGWMCWYGWGALWGSVVVELGGGPLGVSIGGALCLLYGLMRSEGK